MLVKYKTEGPSYLMRELQERKIHGTIQFFFFFLMFIWLRWVLDMECEI